jgi:hypothetical protein
MLVEANAVRSRHNRAIVARGSRRRTSAIYLHAGVNLNRPALDALFAAVFAVVLGVILAPLLNHFWAEMKPAIGVPLIALIGIFILVGIAAFGLAVLHYFRVLGAGAEPVGTRERSGYDALRQRLGRDYARRLEVFLDAIDRFFGDAGMADQTLCPHAFGLRKPAPLWTAPAFDRCLMLVLVYLIAAIVVIWAVGNRVDPAEAAFGLHATDGWRRAATLVAIGFLALAARRAVQATGLRRLAWLIGLFAFPVGIAVAGAGAGLGDIAVALSFAGAFVAALPVAFALAAAGAAALFFFGGHVIFAAIRAVASDRDRADYSDAIGTLYGVLGGVVASIVAVAGAVAGAVAIAFAVAGTSAFAGVFAFAFAVAFAVAFASTEGGSGSGTVVVACAIAVAFAGAGTGAGAGAFAVTVIGAIVVFFMEGNSRVRGWQRTAPPVIFVVMFLVCFADVALLSHLDHWQIFGPQLLFFGPITLITALFGWLSLGLTRALMRRGLERGKWWPYLYAFIDALLALVVMAFLAVAMVATVQLFDHLAASGGGKPVFPPVLEFLDAIKADPGNPEYWWIYAALFSIMLPSLINLFTAGVSLAHGVPGLSSWLLVRVREGVAVPVYDRLLVAIMLTLQGVAGLAIALAAQGFLFWVIIWQGMPRVGIGVLDLAHFIAH